MVKAEDAMRWVQGYERTDQGVGVLYVYPYGLLRAVRADIKGRKLAGKWKWIQHSVLRTVYCSGTDYDHDHD